MARVRVRDVHRSQRRQKGKTQRAPGPSDVHAIVRALLEPAAEIARHNQLTLNDALLLWEEVLFAAHRKKSVVRVCADRLGISMRKSFQIKQRLEAENFATDSTSSGLIANLTVGPLSERTLLRRTQMSPKALRALLRSGLNSGLLSEVTGPRGTVRYRLRQDVTRLTVSDEARLASALRQTLAPVTQTVAIRTQANGLGTATARVFSFPARRQDVQRAVDLLIAGVLQVVTELDRDAVGEDADPCQLSLFFASESKGRPGDNL